MERNWEELLSQTDHLSRKIKKIAGAAAFKRKIRAVQRNIPANETCTLLDTVISERTRGRGVDLSFLIVGSGTLTVTVSVSGETDTLTYTVYPASAVLCRRLDGGDHAVKLTVSATGAISYAEAGAELVDLWEDHHG